MILLNRAKKPISKMEIKWSEDKKLGFAERGETYEPVKD